VVSVLRAGLLLMLSAAPALAQDKPTVRSSESYVIEDAARTATQQMQEAILARAQVAELRAKVDELQKALAEAQKRAEAPK
jgi:hypothetical protein